MTRRAEHEAERLHATKEQQALEDVTSQIRAAVDHIVTCRRHSQRIRARLIEAVDWIQELERLVTLVAQSGVEHDDPRVRYVTVQVDRETWHDVQTAAGWIREEAR